MRLAAVAATLMLITGSAVAQTPTLPQSGTSQPGVSEAPPTGGSQPARAGRGRHTMQERFDSANTTHDGHLTLEQARAGHMVAVARDFAAIDTAHKGYVTVDDIKAHRHAVRMAKKAAKQKQG